MNKPEVKSARTAKEAQAPKKISREELSKQIRKMRDRDAELVTGIFKNLENPASQGGRGSVVFTYKYYPNDEYATYELFDGEKYTLPRGVARHLNNNCYYKQYQQLAGSFENGAPVQQSPVDTSGRLHTNSYQMAKKIHRYAFHSLEYMDDDVDMYPTDLIEVSVSP